MGKITLIVGLIGTGKTEYAKAIANGALVYDLDYLKSSLTFSEVHSTDDPDARKVANAFLDTFIEVGRATGRDLIVIRMAPKLTELERIKPDKLVVMLKEYDVSDREDFHEIDRDEYGMRLNACAKWCDHHNVQIDFKE